MRHRIPDVARTRARQLLEYSKEAEQALWRLLRNRRLSGTKFRRQVQIGFWIADFVSFKYCLVVEADGSQHAGNSRDQRRDVDLNERDFRVARLWNNDILDRPQSVIEAIFDLISNSPSGRAPDGAQPPSPTRGEGK
jgi:very-short-patch-repair endonuclease